MWAAKTPALAKARNAISEFMKPHPRVRGGRLLEIKRQTRGGDGICATGRRPASKKPVTNAQNALCLAIG